MPHLKLSQADIYFEAHGNTGSWVTLVNGHMRSHKDFRAFTKQLVQAGFQVLIFDHRGVGESRYQGSFSLNDLANDVLELWDHLEIAESYLLGISMGGVVSQIVASQVPEQVRRLVLVSTTAHEKWIQAISESPWSQNVAELEAKLKQYFAKGFVSRNQLLIQAMAKQMAKDLQESTYQNGAVDQRSAMRQLDIRNLSRQIQAPTLILHGLEDQVILADAGQELAELIPDSHLELIPDVGHLLLAEYAKNLYRSSIDFFSN
ncbi:MAG: alpha/beta fold hydrolase [Oligoflexus sp.]